MSSTVHGLLIYKNGDRREITCSPMVLRMILTYNKRVAHYVALGQTRGSEVVVWVIFILILCLMGIVGLYRG